MEEKRTSLGGQSYIDFVLAFSVISTLMGGGGGSTAFSNNDAKNKNYLHRF